MKKETLEKAKKLEVQIGELKSAISLLKHKDGFKCISKRKFLLVLNSTYEQYFELSHENKNAVISIVEKELEERQAELEDL